MSRAKDVQFTDAQYSVIVLQCLKRAIRRSSWIAETIIPRAVSNDSPEIKEITEALEFAIDAVRAVE